MDRERQILERVLSLKQLIREERSGPVDLHELGICYFYLENYERSLETLESLIDQKHNHHRISLNGSSPAYAPDQK